MAAWISPIVGGYLKFLGMVVVGEILFILLFSLVSRLFNFGVGRDQFFKEMFKGFLERIMLSVGIAHGVPTVVILFGALKVATKISIAVSDNNKDHVAKHNDYFIVGNLMSVILAIAYAVLAKYAGFITLGI